jgi:transcriptional regulator with XRE-family HTH domain
MIDPDAWRLATPHELLTLCLRLGMTGQALALHLGVQPAAISMWRQGKRGLPRRCVAALRTCTQAAVAQALELNAKAQALAPSATIAQAIQDELRALLARWQAEVLAQEWRRRLHLQRVQQCLAEVGTHEPLTPADAHQLAVAIRLLQDVRETLVAGKPLTVEDWSDTPS